jgi:hypothetical protein
MKQNTKTVAIAERLKQVLIESSPLIEEYTAAVCPDCSAVCCKQKHGVLPEKDIRYLRAVGIEMPPRDETRPLEGPCELMGLQGCVHPRWMRPFRCTWYFCGPLLAALNEGPQKKTRHLTAVLREMVSLYGGLSEE